MVNETDVATSALAIAIAALVIAAGQLIAQLFSTADGYRRCQPSVIGAWYKLVELRFRWYIELPLAGTLESDEIAAMYKCGRHESFFQNQEVPLPEFPRSLFSKKSQYLTDCWVPVPLLGTYNSRIGTFCRPVVDLGVRTIEALAQGVGEDVPTWASLLEDVHDSQLRYINYPHLPEEREFQHGDIICISRKTRSWDFMPPDIVRPVASTTIGSLITIAHRLGMAWTEFRPEEGIMRAVGSGRSFSTSIVRGMGLFVEYSTMASNHGPLFDDRIPSALADEMACGIIRVGPIGDDLHLRGKPATETSKVSDPLYYLKIIRRRHDFAKAEFSLPDPAHKLPAFTDIIGLFGEWMPIKLSPVNAIDNPFPFPLTTMGERPESRNVWRLLLTKREASLSDQLKQVLQFYNNWRDMSYSNFETYYRLYGTVSEQSRFFREAYENTSKYLDKTVGLYGDLYKESVRVHVSVNLCSVQEAEKNVNDPNNRTARNDLLPTDLDPIFVERAYIYTDNVPRFVQQMELYRSHDPARQVSYEDVWWTMMMRLHAWTMSVRWIDREGVKIPSEYYNNPARVYIL